MDSLIKVRPEILGARLKNARAARRITQEAAATVIGVARTTVVAIESGRRLVSLAELRAFAELYDASESELLAEENSPRVEAEIQFRSAVSAKQAENEAATVVTLNRLANAAVQLEALLEMPAPALSLPSIEFSRDEPIEVQAEDAAAAVRARLGLGMGPLQDLNVLLESDLGIRVFERPLLSSVSGALAISETAGAFMLLNVKHRASRRRVTAAHELGHALLRKPGMSVHFEGDEFDSKEEKFCDAFGCSLLMPAAIVRKKASELKQIVGKFTVRELLTMTLYFNVSMEALTRRMVTLHLLPDGTYEGLRAEGLTLKHQASVRADLGLEKEPPRFTPRTMLLAIAAHDRDLLTEQQIASMLELDLLSVRQALYRSDALGDAV
jgi:Zn-dependent peptidase ImmA (M78 family)/DNA-binding XRE family transcriptional regulator